MAVEGGAKPATEIRPKSARAAPGMPLHLLARLVAFALASGLLFGVDIGSIGGALHGITAALELTEVEAEIVVAGAKGGALVGCLIGGAWMATNGRKSAVALASVPFLVGPILLALSSSFVQAMLGRLLMGVGMGIASVAAPCFLSEVAPPEIRGALVAMYELAIAVGFLLASTLNTLIESVCVEGCWRYQAGLVPLLAALPLAVAVTLLPESPRWLLSRAGGDAARLRTALMALRRLSRQGASERLAVADEVARTGTTAGVPAETPWGTSDDDLVALWDKQHEGAGAPLLLSPEMRSKLDMSVDAPERCAMLRALVATVGDIAAVVVGRADVPHGARRGLLLAMMAAALNQICASTSVLVYAQHLLAEAGIDSQQMQDNLALSVSFAKILGVVLGLAIVNKVGRRPLFGFGGAISAASLTALAVGAAIHNVALLLSGMCVFVLAFVSTSGVGYWVVVTEVTVAAGPRYASACQAAATMTLFGSGWLTSLTFVTVASTGRWSLLVYAGFAALTTVYAAVLLPETRGCTLEECAEVVRGAPVKAPEAPK